MIHYVFFFFYFQARKYAFFLLSSTGRYTKYIFSLSTIWGIYLALLQESLWFALGDLLRFNGDMGKPEVCVEKRVRSFGKYTYSKLL